MRRDVVGEVAEIVRVASGVDFYDRAEIWIVELVEESPEV
jgi:hypothetical protein